MLLDDTDIAESTFKLLSEKEALLKSSSIIKRGFGYLEKTTEYGITVEELNDLNAELADLENMQPSIGVITNERKSAGRSIKELTAEARIILDKLDDGFEGLIDNDDFINGWFAVRKIKGRHISKKSAGPKEVN